MKNNISSAANCITVDTIFDLKLERREHKMYPCGAPKKGKQNEIRRCIAILTLSLFLTEVINILHRI